MAFFIYTFMKYLRAFNENVESVESLCKKYIDDYIYYGEYTHRKSMEKGDLSYSINSDDTVNINGQITLNVDDKIPFKINRISTLFLKGDIKTLDNSPNEVTFAFNIGGCRNITSFENGAKRIGTFFHLGGLKIDNFTDLPRPLKEEYQITTSDMYMRELFSVIFKPKYTSSGKENGYYIIDNEVCDNIEIFTDFDPIRPNNEYSLSRLNQYFEQIGHRPIKELKYWKNID